MKTCKLSLLWISLLMMGAFEGFAFGKGSAPVVVAYVTSWSTVLPDPALVTHINYAFGHVSNTFDGVRIDKEERLKALADLKKNHPSLKVMLSIGGWKSGRFSEMASAKARRKAFAADCRRVVDQFGLDGIDLDWEYPTSSESGISSSPEDTENFSLLMREIRKAIGPKKLLTMASEAGARYVDFKAINPVIDFVNIMTYDIDRPPYHHSGLYRSSHTGRLSGEEAVNAHIRGGIPAEKLTLGIPFYGHGVSGIPDFIDYRQILNLKGFIRTWDDVAKVPYLVNDSGAFVCTYEDPQSIAAKCDFILEKGLLGAMYWEYDGDDQAGSLRRAVFHGVRQTKGYTPETIGKP